MIRIFIVTFAACWKETGATIITCIVIMNIIIGVVHFHSPSSRY